MTRTPRKSSGRWMVIGMILALAASPLGMANLGQGVAAQEPSGAMDPAKESEKLQKKADQAKAAIDQTKKELDSAMTLYNSIIGGQEKDPRSAHKKLVGVLDGVMKKRAANATKWDEMKAMSQKFFEGWEAEIAKYTDESIKTAGQARLSAAKDRYAKLSEALTGARETYGQFLTNFKDQATYMGRDLSPAALAQLQEPAAKLNEQYKSLQAKGQEMMSVIQQNRVALTGKETK